MEERNEKNETPISYSSYPLAINDEIRLDFFSDLLSTKEKMLPFHAKRKVKRDTDRMKRSFPELVGWNKILRSFCCDELLMEQRMDANINALQGNCITTYQNPFDSNDIRLVYPCGPLMDQVGSCGLKELKEDYLDSTETKSKSTVNSIFHRPKNFNPSNPLGETVLQFENNQSSSLFLIRTEHKCFILKESDMQSDSVFSLSGLQWNETLKLRERIADVALPTIYDDHFAFVTEYGGVSICDIGEETNIYEERPNKSKNNKFTEWNHLEYASIGNSLFVGSPMELSLLDIKRSRTEIKIWQRPQIRGSILTNFKVNQATDFELVLSTSNSVQVVDYRFLRDPLIYWSYEDEFIRNLSIMNLPECDLILGNNFHNSDIWSQTYYVDDGKTTFDFQPSNSVKSFKQSLKHQLSACSTLLDEQVMPLFEEGQMIGMHPVKTDFSPNSRYHNRHSITLFQLNQFGDIFFQSIEVRNREVKNIERGEWDTLWKESIDLIEERHKRNFPRSWAQLNTMSRQQFQLTDDFVEKESKKAENTLEIRREESGNELHRPNSENLEDILIKCVSEFPRNFIEITQCVERNLQTKVDKSLIFSALKYLESEERIKSYSTGGPESIEEPGIHMFFASSSYFTSVIQSEQQEGDEEVIVEDNEIFSYDLNYLRNCWGQSKISELLKSENDNDWNKTQDKILSNLGTTLDEIKELHVPSSRRSGRLESQFQSQSQDLLSIPRVLEKEKENRKSKKKKRRGF